MGKSRNDLIQIAAEACSSFFARAHLKAKPQSIEELKQHLREGAEFSVRASLQQPIFLKAYFKYKGGSNAIGEAISKYETFWLRIFTQNFKRVLKVSEKQAETMAQTILMIRMGICHQLICNPLPEKEIIEAIDRLNAFQLLVTELSQNKLKSEK
jgi:hypothetical protein